MGCNFPKLKILLLRGFESGEEELSAFLHQCGQIEQLVIQNHNLYAVETWHKTLIRTCNNTRSEPIGKIDQLMKTIFDEEKQNDWKAEKWADFSLGLTTFLFHTLGGAYVMEHTWLCRKDEGPAYHTLDPAFLDLYCDYWGDFPATWTTNYQNPRQLSCSTFFSGFAAEIKKAVRRLLTNPQIDRVTCTKASLVNT